MDYESIITVLVIAFIMYFITHNVTKFEDTIHVKKKKNDGILDKEGEYVDYEELD